jgi:hypothetical protein
MATRRLTDRTLQTLKRAEPRRRYEVMDAEVRGFGVRVNDRGRKTFILIARYPGSPHPARRSLGEYGVMTLGDAREEARKWRKLLGEGVDPRVEKERRRLAEARRQENSFASVAEDYFSYIKRQKLRRAAEVERDIRREFVTRWAKRPITDITRDDLMAVIEAAIQRDAPWQAHHAFSYANRLFNWAIAEYTDLKVRPASACVQQRLSAGRFLERACCRTMSCALCGGRPSGSGIRSARSSKCLP